ncbi:MAG: four helix bundle protein [Balneolaceae bacterium]|nr:four helix bundle protein [Balneolaceae bacterium]
MTVKRFEDLEIWQEARELCKEIYNSTLAEPFAKDYKLRGQIRRSSGSIMDNIAEGFERGGNKEFIQFLSIAKGSCGETRSQLYRASDCGYITAEEFELLYGKTVMISKKISSLMNYLSKSEIKGPKFKQ